MLTEDEETYRFYKMFLNKEQMNVRYKNLINKENLSPKGKLCLNALKKIKTEDLLNINNNLQPGEAHYRAPSPRINK